MKNFSKNAFIICHKTGLVSSGSKGSYENLARNEESKRGHEDSAGGSGNILKNGRFNSLQTKIRYLSKETTLFGNRK
jgi:hypothetical protein